MFGVNIHDKHLNFLFIIYITFNRRDANLANLAKFELLPFDH